MDPELQRVAAQVAASAVRNSATVVWDRVRVTRAKKADAETISELEQIIAELIDDKNELLRVAKVYEEALVSQRISDDDITYITETIVPFLEEMAGETANAETVKQLRSIISVDTVKLLQIIGFNFSRALGEPLTELARLAILAQAPPPPDASAELQRLGVEREIAVTKLASDPDGFARMMRAFNRD